MNILITNDDGYTALGIHTLAKIMCQFGKVTVIAPKKHQSGMSMAVSLSQKVMAYRELPEEKIGTWSYLDATPASCIKYGFNFPFLEEHPDIVVCGINHGSNAASATCYSGTMGAAEEAALNGVLSIGVSVDCTSPDVDFSAVEIFFPAIFKMLYDNRINKYGIFYNVNFPNIPAEMIMGIRIGYQGKGIWVREFREMDIAQFPTLEKGEKAYGMKGDFIDNSLNTDEADHHILGNRYISIVPEKIDRTDYEERQRLINLDFNKDFNK
jgi:5'-nucleotidase